MIRINVVFIIVINILYSFGSQYDVVSIDNRQQKKTRPTPAHAYPIQCLSGSFSVTKRGRRGLISTSHIHLAPRLRKNEATPLLPYSFRA